MFQLSKNIEYPLPRRGQKAVNIATVSDIKRADKIVRTVKTNLTNRNLLKN